MLALWLFIIRTSTHVYLEVISNNKCLIFTMKEILRYRINDNKSFSKTRFAYLVIINSFATDIYMEDISDMKFQLHHIHL